MSLGLLCGGVLTAYASQSVLQVFQGGTGWGNIQANTVLLGNGTNAVATTTAGTNGQVLALSNGVPTWVATSSINNGVTSVATTYPVTGGTITTTGTIALAFGTTTSNIWAGTQTFTNAPIFSSLTGCLTGNGSSAITALGTCATFAYPFTTTTNFGQTIAATTTAIWAQGSPISLMASSTFAFVNATSTGEVQGTDTVNSFVGRISPTHRLVLSTGTTTAWTASTTGTAYSPFVTAPFSGTVKQVYCLTDQSFLGVNIQVNGSNVTPSYFIASTTAGNITLTAGNTFTKGQKILMNAGTTTTATTQELSCTADVVETP